MAVPAASPHDQFEQLELSQLIERSFAALPADQRLVLTLCDVHGFAYDEIAEMTGVPMGTVKSRINRARNLLREKLEKFLAEAPVRD